MTDIFNQNIFSQGAFNKTVFGSAGGVPYDPLNIPDLTMYIRAGESVNTLEANGKINAITDLTGNGNNLESRFGNTGANEVSYVEISPNGGPSYLLEGALSELRKFGYSGAGAAATLFLTFQPSPTRTIENGNVAGFISSFAYIGFTDAGAPFYVRDETRSSVFVAGGGAGLITDTEPHFCAVSVADADTAFFYCDGQVSASFNPNNAYNGGNIRFGNGGYNSPECYMYEFGVANRGMTKEELDAHYAWALG